MVLIRKIVLIFLICFFVTVSSMAVHELIHQYNFKKIKQICFFGYEKDKDFKYSGFGWVLADDYWHYEEKIPMIVSLVYAIIVTVILSLVFVWRKD